MTSNPKQPLNPIQPPTTSTHKQSLNLIQPLATPNPDRCTLNTFAKLQFYSVFSTGRRRY